MVLHSYTDLWMMIMILVLPVMSWYCFRLTIPATSSCTLLYFSLGSEMIQASAVGMVMVVLEIWDRYKCRELIKFWRWIGTGIFLNHYDSWVADSEIVSVLCQTLALICYNPDTDTWGYMTPQTEDVLHWSVISLVRVSQSHPVHS